MTYSALLLLALLLPLLGAVAIFALGEWQSGVSRRIALFVSLATLVVAGRLALAFPPGEAAFAVTDYPWLGGETTPLDIRFNVGLDGLSVWLFALSALLSVTAVLVSWEAIRERTVGFYSLLLLLETGMLGVFVARDLILFYVFFEFTLIPLFFLIGIWGSEERRRAAVKFFLYTFAGSVLTFLGLLSIVWWVYSQGAGRITFSIPELTAAVTARPIDPTWQWWIFLALFAGFAIKVPLFPFHTWLPLAHVQAPTAGSVLLAGILLKIGGYGFARFNMPLLPDATAALMPWILWLSAAGIVYGALVALAQSDIKRLIAYSSVSHLGFCILGMFAANRIGMEGGVLQLLNHGLSTGGLFAIIGMLYERYHTRDLRQLGGLARRLPLLTVMMLIFTFSSIGLPGTNGFAGEIMILVGMFQRGFAAQAPLDLGWQLQVIAVVSLTGVVLGAWYMLWLVQRAFFGPLREPSGGGHGDHGEAAHHEVHDLSLRELAALLPLVVFVFWIGLAPGYFLKRMAPTVDAIADGNSRQFKAHFFPPLTAAIEADAAASPSHPQHAQSASPSGATEVALAVDAPALPLAPPQRDASELIEE